MNATSPKSSLVKLGLYPRQKTLKIMVLGQAGVGKSGNIHYCLGLNLFYFKYISKFTKNNTKLY